MHRFVLVVIASLAVLSLAACGGGSSNATSPSAVSSVKVPTATPTDKPLAQPTPPQPGEPILQIKSGKNAYNPTRADVEKLDSATITIKGKDYKGVTLATLAAKVSAASTAQATILGTNALGTRIAGALLSLKNDGTNSVFIISDDGYLRLAASSLDPSMWLVDVTSIVFQ